MRTPMFGMNAIEVCGVILWILGVAAAIVSMRRRGLGVRSLLVLALAVSVPFIGSLVAIVGFLMERIDPDSSQLARTRRS